VHHMLIYDHTDSYPLSKLSCIVVHIFLYSQRSFFEPAA